MMNEILNELDFIRERTLWLQSQARDSDGALMCADYRDECGVMLRRVHEIEAIAVTT
jgi:hypothetical protein